jgi:hypothetical protein
MEGSEAAAATPASSAEEESTTTATATTSPSPPSPCSYDPLATASLENNRIPFEVVCV